MIKQLLAKRGPSDFMRLGYMRPSLAPEVVAALVEHSERLQVERDAVPPAAPTTMSISAAACIGLSITPPTYDEQRAQWQLGDDVGACPNCGHSRLCKCPNGKRRCGKCNWCSEDGAYAPAV